MDLTELVNAAQAEMTAVQTAEQLESFRIKYLGAKGLLKQASDHIKQIPADQKRSYGQALNAVKQTITEAFEKRKSELESQPTAVKGVDVTEPGHILHDSYRPGCLHLIQQTIDDLIDLFSQMGYSVADGPELEDEFHNFEALNVPLDHPARHPLDNFYLDLKPDEPPLMLRSQTSSVQIRVLESHKPPVRIIAPGRVYRPDTVDATHSFMFHQLEGLYVDKNVTMVDLKTCIDLFARAFFGDSVRTRFRPSFFPFTEPSAEFDIQFTSAGGSSRWVELGGCGMVDPNVLSAVGIDPQIYSGFAFGLGIERIVMRRHGIADIRDLFQNDVRFLRQFA